MTSQKECIEEAIDIFRLVIKEFFEICKSILEAEHHLIIPLARRGQPTDSSSYLRE